MQFFITIFTIKLTKPGGMNMKKCPKCGLTFDDNTNFCPACGEKLVKEEPKCPSCGTPYEEGDKFCKNCGAKLGAQEAPKEEPKPVEQPKEEPKVEEKPKEEPAVVPAPVVKEESKPEPVKEEAKVEEPKPEEKQSSKGQMIVNMIIAGVCLLAALFLFIGIFGPVFSAKMTYGGSYQRTSYGFKYFFKDGPDNLRSIRDANMPRSSYYNYCLSQFALECVFFFGGMAGCLACTIVGVVKNIMALTKKQEPNIDILITAGTLRLLSVLYLYAKYANDVNAAGYYVNTSFGWGGGLIITALAFLLAASAAKNIFGAISKKDGIPGAIVRAVASLVIFILIFNVFSPLTKIVGSNGYYTERISTNGYSFAETVLSAYSQSSSGTLQTGIFVPGIMSLYFAFAGMLVMLAAFKKSLDEKSKTAPIVNTALALFFLILSAGLSLSATYAYAEYAGLSSGYVINFASGPVAGIVLTFVVVLPALIVSNILGKKKE